MRASERSDPEHWQISDILEVLWWIKGELHIFFCWCGCFMWMRLQQERPFGLKIDECAQVNQQDWKDTLFLLKASWLQQPWVMCNWGIMNDGANDVEQRHTMCQGRAIHSVWQRQYMNQAHFSTLQLQKQTNTVMMHSIYFRGWDSVELIMLHSSGQFQLQAGKKDGHFCH